MEHTGFKQGSALASGQRYLQAAPGRAPVAGDGVQEHSKGDLFPAVIFRTERYTSYEQFMAGRPGDIVTTAAQFYDQPLEQRLESKWWSVILDGVVEEGLSSYDEAEQCARGMLAQCAARVVA